MTLDSDAYSFRIDSRIAFSSGLDMRITDIISYLKKETRQARFVTHNSFSMGVVQTLAAALIIAPFCHHLI